jgi:dienelactone hydrolase
VASRASNFVDRAIFIGCTLHGFNADYGPSYRKEATEDRWGRMTARFKQYL